MWCAVCQQSIDDVIDHEMCKQNIWLALSQENTQFREAFKKQYDFAPKGETVEIRPPLTRSKSR
jgi:hypothetical protein